MDDTKPITVVDAFVAVQSVFSDIMAAGLPLPIDVGAHDVKLEYGELPPFGVLNYPVGFRQAVTDVAAHFGTEVHEDGGSVGTLVRRAGVRVHISAKAAMQPVWVPVHPAAVAS